MTIIPLFDAGDHAAGSAEQVGTYLGEPSRGRPQSAPAGRLCGI